jgi:predicted AAA+ superfamily ATPase
MLAQAQSSSILPRAVDSLLTTVLRTMRVVVVAGPRQAGKSTLVRAHPELASRSYVSLDDVSTLLRARADRRGFLGGAQAITIDEVQRDPGLIPVLKGLVDEQPPHRTGHFVLTGSANLAMMSHISDALAGRAYYLRLQPLTRREQQRLAATGCWTSFFETPLDRWMEALLAQPAIPEVWQEVVRRGGFPGAALEMPDEATRSHWFAGYVETYLERDLRELKSISNLPRFQALMRAAAGALGGLVNHAELAREVRMPQTTVHEHLRLLETTFQVVRLAPFTRSSARRAIKTAKLYWNDVALALHLGGGEAGDAHLENYVLSDLMTWRDTEVPRPEVSYWRTAGGTEVDFVIERKQRLLAIQVRSTTAPTARDATHLRTFFREYGPAVSGGLVLHAGDETRWLDERILAVPWWRVL